MKFDNNFIRSNEIFEFWGQKYSADDISISSEGEIQITGHPIWSSPIGCTSSTSDICFDWAYEKKKSKFKIKKVQVNPNKNATTVIFEDGSVEVVKKAQEDPETDLFSAVAYAVAKHIYGSNSAFKREVVKNIQFTKDKELNKLISKTSIGELNSALRDILNALKREE